MTFQRLNKYLKWVLFLFLAHTQIYCSPTTKKSEKTPTRPPNIVLIFTDDQGYQDLSCYGSPDIRTPNIDQMAKRGIRFTNFYVSQPVCSASRSSLLTGCYANRIGINGALFPKAPKGLNPQETTIAEMLKPLGYATAIYGKWHLGDRPDFLPTKQGFDEYFGVPFSNDMWPHHPSNDKFKFEPLPLMNQDTVLEYLDDQSQLTTQYTEHAVSFIEKNKDQPFFLYVPHSMPHVPLFVSDKFKGKSPRGPYGDVIEEIDWSVGEILKSLEKNGLTENTLVIFTSDNGPWLNYGDHSGEALPLREGKGTAWEGGVRVPCVMQWPGNIPAGSESNLSAMTIDVLPTIAEITGADLPTLPIDGKSILPILKGDSNAKTPHDAYYFYYNTNELHAVLSGKWKLYFPHNYRTLSGRAGGKDGLPVPYDYIDMEMELYDLESDISETKNVIADHPEVVERLSQLAEKARADMGDKLTDRVGAGSREPGLVDL